MTPSPTGTPDYSTEGSMPARARPDAGTWLAATLVGWCALVYAAHLWAAVARLDLPGRPGALMLALAFAAAFWLFAMKRPLWATLALLASIPFFGNHPGGRLMEIFNLPLAASTAGLALYAARERRPPPAGHATYAAAAFVAAALLALVPALAGILVRASQLNHWPTTIMAALTAPEDDPLYSLSTAVGLTLCVGWTIALVWAAPDRRFLTRAIRVLIYLLFAVMGLGILDYHGAIAIAPSYLLAIDPRRPDVSGFQSIFWNPGWFAWYFVMVFGLALGHLWTAGRRERIVVAVLLTISYLYFFTNPQRGGFVALHVCLLAAGGVVFFSRQRPQRARRALMAAAIALVIGVAAAYALELIPRSLGSSLFRLVASPEEAQTSNSVRARLWTVALRMWRDAPVFGLGEATFAWRFEDYAPVGTALYTSIHGDAHNTWLQMLATRGLFGVITLVAVLGLAGRSLHSAWRAGVADRGLIAGAALALIGFTVYSTVQGMFYLQSIHALFWFLIACAGLVSSQPTLQMLERPLSHDDRGWRFGARASLLAVAVAVVAALILQVSSSVDLYQSAATTIAREPRGFYSLESDPASPSWRWSTGDGTLCLQPAGPVARVQMSVGDPRITEYPRLVTMRIDGQVIDRITVAGPDVFSRDLTLLSEAPSTRQPAAFGECTGGSNEVRLSVEVDRTWSPLSAGIGTDPRTLGVRLFEPVYPPATGSDPAVPGFR